jgi:hypothetical protein
MAATVAHAQDLPRDRVDAIPSLMDATVPKLMEAGHVPGTSIAYGDGGMMLHAWGASYERIEWHEGAAFHVVFVATCAIVFALYPTTRSDQAAETGVPGPEGRLARWCAAASSREPGFIVWLVFSLRGWRSFAAGGPRANVSAMRHSPPWLSRSWCFSIIGGCWVFGTDRHP